MAALVAVMVFAAFGTFDWHSIAPSTLKRMPIGEVAVMVVTVAFVVATSNLAIGVVAGTLTAIILFARRVAHRVAVTVLTDPDGTNVVYTVTGELFFASSNNLIYQFNYTDDPAKVTIDLAGAHIWDASTVAALDTISGKYEARGKTVEIAGLNEQSATMHGRLTERVKAAV
jgi:SulP family sulfate permease